MLSLKKSSLAISLAALSSASYAIEQDAVIVTATRTAQTVDETLSSVTVITEKQIQQQQAHDLPSLLTAISGIDMSVNGGMGKKTSIFMRGTSSTHLLVMVDGIKMGSATSGDIAFQHIPVNQIERIEIIRGPRASLYGSEAIGGVIQIFTKKGKAQQQTYAEVGYGSYATNTFAAGISGKSDKTSYAFNATHLSNEGFDAEKDSETDLDGYKNNSLSLNLSHELSKTSALAVNLLHASGETEYDGSYTNNTDFLQQTAGLQYTLAAAQNWNIKLNASQSLDESDNFKDATFKSKFNTARDTFSWQNDINLSDNQLLTIGVDYQNDTVDSTTKYDESSRNNAAGFIQHQWFGEKNDLQISARRDDNQAFGAHSTGGISWGHEFANKLRLISSYGSAFKAPTFNQLYYPSYGNSKLKPEESKSYEMELRKTSDWGKWSMSAYQTNITNLISGNPVSNVDKARIRGLELRLNTVIAGYNTQLEVAAIDPRDEVTNKILQRRTQRTAKLNIDKEYGKWASGMSIVAQGKRYDDKANEKLLKGYTTFNLRTRYAFTKSFSIKGKIENLFDDEYETAKDYNSPGRSVFVTLSYTGF